MIRPKNDSGTAQTPRSLHLAVYARNVELVHEILYEVPDIDQIDYRGLTALHIAIGVESLPIARLLVSAGAAFIGDRYGRMPSLLAADCRASDELLDFILNAEENYIQMLASRGKIP
jgi:ankyrin repeat protein